MPSAYKNKNKKKQTLLAIVPITKPIPAIVIIERIESPLHLLAYFANLEVKKKLFLKK